MTEAEGEFELINRFRQLARHHPQVVLGIGDDAAAVAFSRPHDVLVAVDTLCEDVHFRLSETTPRLVGRKALGVNLSDLAAMAGLPKAALVSLILPHDRSPDLAIELFEGLNGLAEEFDVAVIGGDTNSWNGPLVISVTVMGEATGRGPVLRSGAVPGDLIMLTGNVGGSSSGRHLEFTPRVREALVLQERVELHSMIDISDGLAADLHHILDESGVGAILSEANIPYSREVLAIEDRERRLKHAFGDGEDFELLFTVDAADAEALLEQSLFEAKLTRIGEITKETGCRIKRDDGTIETVASLGWVHQ